MRKRLFDGLDQGLGEEIILLDGLPPASGLAVYCPLCWGLRQALALMGRAVPYERLMGLTGAGFMLPLREGFATDWAASGVDRHLTEALAALGIGMRRERPISPEETLSLCRDELRAGRPIVAEGWEADWAVIVGLRGPDLLGLAPGSDRPFERHAAVLQSLVLLEARADAPFGDRADRAVLRRALVLLEDNESRWLAWQERLSAPEPYGPELGRLERIVTEQYTCACVLDARDAAAQFLAAMADEAAETLAEGYARAAQAADRLVATLEQLPAPPEVIEWAHLAQDGAWLEERRELLEGARRHERDLGGMIQEVLTLADEEG